MTTRRAAIGTAAALLLGLLLPVTANAVGASPGVALGGNGASWQGHAQRFVAVPSPAGTLVTELRRAGGASLHSRAIPGSFGIPAVAYDGSVEQVPATSPTMVVAGKTASALPRRSRFVVLSTRDLHVVRRITLDGAFAFDALSPDGATMYLTRHTSLAHITRYTVRAYDIRGGRLLPGVIGDKSEGEWRMDGMPASRIQTGDGGWAYTLYQGGEDGAFVHALDTRTGTAHCIDIPGMTNRDVMGMRLRLTDGGGRLVVRSGARAVAAIDTYTFELVSARSQTQKHRPAPAPSGASSSGTSEAAWGIGIVVVLLAGAGLVGVRRRMPHNPAHGGRS